MRDELKVGNRVASEYGKAGKIIDGPLWKVRWEGEPGLPTLEDKLVLIPEPDW